MMVAVARVRTVCGMRLASARPRSPRRSRSESGFSLLELLVAMLLIDVALLSIVHTHAVLVRHRNDTRLRAAAVAAATTRIEQLLASPCVESSGSSLGPAWSELWSAQIDGHTREIDDSVTFGVSAPHTVVLRTRFPC
jgi:Tfp pilus assembly protein PilV